MSNAHRPTYHPAKAQENQGGNKRWTPTIAISAKQMPSDLKLKERQIGQNSGVEIKERDLKAELLEKEKKHFEKKENVEKPTVPNDSDAELDSDDSEDEKVEEKKENSKDDGEDSDDSDDDEELLRELEKIKKERELERLEKEKEEIENQERKEMEEVLNSNPLMNNDNTGLKRKWNDDVIFKNQARDEPKSQKRFINDTIRSDFHKKFMYKFIK
jgi:protein CWC15